MIEISVRFSLTDFFYPLKEAFNFNSNQKTQATKLVNFIKNS